MPLPVYPLVLSWVAISLALLGAYPALRGRGSAALALGALVLSLAAAAWRTAQVGHLPLAGLHETLLTFGVCVALVATSACLGAGTWRTYGISLVGAGALIGFASATPARPTPLLPALQTLWFEVHVASSFVSYACFAVSAAASAVHLAGVGQGEEPRVLERANLWGFAWFTWAMVSGGIWAYLAWGTYWLWHVKELWSGMLWTYYAGMVHLPHMRGWRGRRQAALSLLGFAIVLFTYLGVGLLMRNTHQF